MEKLKVVIVSNDIDLKIKIKNLLGSDEIAISSFLEYDGMTGLKITGYNPDAVILIYDKKEGRIFEIADQIYSELSCTGVILLSADIDLKLL